MKGDKTIGAAKLGATGLLCAALLRLVPMAWQAAEAMRLYDAAQLAFVSGRRAVLRVDDARKHGGYCFAPRINVLGE